MHLAILILVSLCTFVFSENENDSVIVEPSGKTSSDILLTSTPIPTDNSTCEQNNESCKKCLENKECFYCESTKICHALSMESLLPDDKCPFNQRSVGTCKMSLMVVMILVGVAVGVVIIGIICCCCCCCRRDGKIRLSKDDLKWARQREERKARAEEKRLERAARTEEIRRKYGLFKDDAPYQRFDA